MKKGTDDGGKDRSMAEDGKIIIGTKIDETGLKAGISHVESSLDGLKKKIAGLGIGAALGAGIKQAASNFSAFESSLAGASTLFGDVAVDMESLSGSILKLSNDTGIAATSINEGLYQALSAGVPVTEDMGVAMDFLSKSAKLAKAGFTDMPIAIEATAKTLNAYGMSVEEAGRIQDILIQTQNLGITTVDELGRSLANVTPIASSFGVSFEQVGASLALITAKGTPTAQATTQLRQVISELGKDGTQASKALADVAKSAGLPATTFKELMEEGYDLGQLLSLMQKEAEKSGKSILDMFSSIEAGQAALAITSDLERFTNNLDAMAGSAGGVSDAYDIMGNTLEVQYAILKTKIKNISITIGNSLKEPFKNGLQALNIMLDGFQKYFPVIQIGFEAVGQIATVVFESLKLKFGEMKEALDKFLDFSGLKPVIEVFLSPVGDLWENLKRFSETGELSYLVGGVKDAITIGLEVVMGTKALSSVISTVNSGLGLVGGTALTLGVLSVGIAFYEAQKEGDWVKFGEDLIAALIAGLAVGGLSANVQAGVLTATLVLNLEIGSKIADLFSGKNKAVTVAEQNAFAKNAEAYSAIISNRYTTNIQKLKQMAAVDSVTIGQYLAKGFGLGLEDLDQIAESRARGIVKQFEKELEINSPSRKAKRIGSYFAQGFKNGTKELSEIGTSDAKSFLDSFNESLGIHSPSKEGEKSGEYFVQGFVNGTVSLVDAVEGITKEALAKAKEALDEQSEGLMPTAEVKALTDAIDDLGISLDGVDEKIVIFGDDMKRALAGGITSAVTNMTEALMNGEDGWGAFAKTALNALASVLESISMNLAAQAVLEKNWSMGAQAIVAAAGAGIIRGWAGAFATGGIVQGPYDGTDNLVASVKAGEVILNHAQAQNTAKLLSRMDDGGGAVVINFNGDVYGDKEQIALMVYEKQKTMMREGRLERWS